MRARQPVTRGWDSRWARGQNVQPTPNANDYRETSPHSDTLQFDSVGGLGTDCHLQRFMAFGPSSTSATVPYIPTSEDRGFTAHFGKGITCFAALYNWRAHSVAWLEITTVVPSEATRPTHNASASWSAIPKPPTVQSVTFAVSYHATYWPAVHRDSLCSTKWPLIQQTAQSSDAMAENVI